MTQEPNVRDTDLDVPGLNDIAAPLHATDAEIDGAVADAGLLPLLMAVVHITGSLDILDAAGRTEKPQFSTDVSGSIPPEQAVALRMRAAAAIKAWRDLGCPESFRPDADQLHRMIDVLTGKPLEPDYGALIAEELGLDGDARAFVWDKSVDDAAKARLPVLVVGAGLSGLAMGYRLKQAGLPFTIIEKNAGPGGTWYENRFPGARVDVPSHCYSYSFVRDQTWPDLFSPWPVLRQYFRDAVQRFGLADHIRYQTEVVRAEWHEAEARWSVTLRTAPGEETVDAAALVSAVGQLNRPLIPDIAGQDDFAGVRVHTSRWPADLSVAGKKVIVIGTAATALQLVPELAREATELSVFQRSPTWVFVHPEYRRAIRPGEQWAIDHLPGYARWYRVILYNWALDGVPEHMLIDPEWTGGDHAVSAANDAARVRLTAAMKAAIGDRPDLHAKLIPTYPPYVKRPNLGDGGFFRAFSQPNVHLVTDGVDRFVADGIVDKAGVHHAADIVVYATGFRALEYLAPMEIIGRGGRRLSDFWGDEPRAYLGITVPEFPNLFLMYGPGTNLGFNGNLFFNGEAQARYVMGTLKWMAEDGLRAVEVKPDVFAGYARKMDETLARFTWSHGGAGSWYKNKSGKVVANSPWPLLTYWRWTRAPDPADFRTDPAAAPRERVMDAANEAKLQDLVDRHEIWTLLLRYARGLDRLDRDLIRSCYWDDAIDDHHSFVGSPDAFIDWAFGHARDGSVVQHHGINNHFCEIEGDDAHSETYYTFIGANVAPPHMLSIGRYIDHFQRRGGVWKMANRVTVIEKTFDLHEAALDALTLRGDTRPGALLSAGRDRDDLSYRRPVVPRRPV